MVAGACLGYAALVVCELGCLKGAALVSPVGGGATPTGLVAVVTLGTLPVYAAAALWKGASRRFERACACAGAVCLVCALAALRLLHPAIAAGRPWRPGAVAAACVSLGMGCAGLKLAWGCVFSRLAPERVPLAVTLAWLAGLTGFLGVNGVPKEVGLAGYIACAGASWGLWALVARRQREPASASALFHGEALARAALARPLFYLAALSFAGNLVLALSRENGDVSPQGAAAGAYALLGAMLAAMVAQGGVGTRRQARRGRAGAALFDMRVYGVAVSITAAGFMLLPFVCESRPQVGVSLANLGSMLLSLTFWGLMASTAARTHTSPARVFGTCLAATGTASLLGSALGLAAASRLGFTQAGMAGLALVALYGLVLLAVGMARGRQRAARPLVAAGAVDETGGARPPVVVVDDERMRLRAEELAVTVGLTRREAEVLPLLAQGQPVASMARILGISENTVKSHVRAIYRKAGVSSRSQLMEYLAGEG